MAWFRGSGAGKTQIAMSDPPGVGNADRALMPESSETLMIRGKVAPQVGLEPTTPRLTGASKRRSEAIRPDLY
jgi:hypothetical protein